MLDSCRRRCGRDAGVPIVSSTGRNGGIKLADDYMIDKTFLSESEIGRLKDALDKTANLYGDKINLAISNILSLIILCQIELTVQRKIFKTHAKSIVIIF